MDTAHVIWGGIIAAGAAFEMLALLNKRDEDTLSELTRSVFRVKTTRVGRWVFGVTWAATSTWFFGHVLYGWPFPGL